MLSQTKNIFHYLLKKLTLSVLFQYTYIFMALGAKSKTQLQIAAISVCICPTKRTHCLYG